MYAFLSFGYFLTILLWYNWKKMYWYDLEELKSFIVDILYCLIHKLPKWQCHVGYDNEPELGGETRSRLIRMEFNTIIQIMFKVTGMHVTPI